MLRVREGAVRAACLSGRPCARCVSWIWVTFRPGSWSTWLHRSAHGRAPPICSLPSPWPRYNGPFTNPARNIKEERGAEERKRALKTPLDGGKNANKTRWRPSVPSVLVVGGIRPCAGEKCLRRVDLRWSRLCCSCSHLLRAGNVSGRQRDGAGGRSCGDGTDCFHPSPPEERQRGSEDGWPQCCPEDARWELCTS